MAQVFADWYCRWCMQKMLDDTRQMLQIHDKVDHAMI
jgi:hypothetical protein